MSIFKDKVLLITGGTGSFGSLRPQMLYRITDKKAELCFR